ncbi:NDUFAF6 [Mytilus coruscus]|uniref:NDUFAF6 n=1 Tax=Mytilus coruscus TaxID=42192 RepID=A0A6J8DV30_MYTCO|nr:NDUFAF6 [Mytilus coruscus]
MLAAEKMTFMLFNCSKCLKGRLYNVVNSSDIRTFSKSSKTKESSRQSNFQYCVDLVRKYDYENYLCARLYPPSLMPIAFAIQAFNVETAQIGDIHFASDIKTGLIRMQFWKDSIEKIYEGSPPHTPTALAMSQYSKLNADFYKNIKDIEDYSEDTKASILYLFLESEGITDKQVHHVASHIGKSQGVVTLLRGLPYNSSKGRIYLPRESLLKFKISGEDVMRGRKQKEICDIVFEVASVAKQHLETARSMKKDVPSSVLPLFLNSVICDKYLKQLQKVDFNVFHPSLQKKNGLLPLQLLLQKIGKKY